MREHETTLRPRLAADPCCRLHLVEPRFSYSRGFSIPFLRVVLARSSTDQAAPEKVTEPSNAAVSKIAFRFLEPPGSFVDIHTGPAKSTDSLPRWRTTRAREDALSAAPTSANADAARIRSPRFRAPAARAERAEHVDGWAVWKFLALCGR